MTDEACFHVSGEIPGLRLLSRQDVNKPGVLESLKTMW